MLPPPHPPTPITTFSTCSTNHFSTVSVVNQPSQYDIVCGRNSGAYNCIGNRRFRATVKVHLQRYIDSPTREDKTKVIKSIVWMLHEDIGARFLKKTVIKKKNDKKTTGRPNNKGTPRYEVMNEKQAREKVGHALRDLVIQARKSASKSASKSKAASKSASAVPNVTTTNNTPHTTKSIADEDSTPYFSNHYTNDYDDDDDDDEDIII